jgi:IMP dehydrogenase
MRFLHPERDAELELSLDDVFLVPGRFDGGSRQQVDLTPPDFTGGSHPIVAANMNAVTGKRMAETMARYGGLGILPQDMTLETASRIVAHIKQASARFDTALEVGPDASLRDVQGIIRKRSHGMVVVVDSERRPLGIVTPYDLRGRDQYTFAHRIMSRSLVTISPDTSNREAFLKMEEEHVKAAPVVDAEGRLLGILSREDAVRLELLRPSLDKQGRLLVGAALGISAQAPQLAVKLMEMGVDALVLDTAHGHQRRMLEAIRAVRAAVGDKLPLIAGNVCTAQGAEDLIEAGADVLKVNVGPGAMCTTRMQTGVGRPTFSAVRACAEVALAAGKHVWADGGVKHPRDVALYQAAGASRVMVGTMLCGTYESPGDVKEDHEGALYKENYGMASARAVMDRTSELDAFEQAKKAFFREGISTSKIYLTEGRESVGDIVIEVITGLQSAYTYEGAMDWQSFHERAVVGVQSAAGYYEGTPHGKIRR